MGPGLETVKIWAQWDSKKVPRFTLFHYAYYVPTHDTYVFKERKGNRVLAYKLDTLRLCIAAGVFKPFVIVTEGPKSYV